MIVWIISAALLCPFLLEYIFRCWVAGRIRTVIESVPPLAITEEPSESKGQSVRSRLPDGEECEFALFRSTPRPRGVILFLPELDGTCWSAPLYCQCLIDAGFAVVSVEFQPGTSLHSAPIHWTTERDLERVDAAIDFIRADSVLQALPLAVFGVSRGGTAALLTAARRRQVRTVVTDSGYSSMGLTRSFINRFGRQLIPEWLFDKLPAWHINKALWAAFGLSEQARLCRYAHLEHQKIDREIPTLMIRGSRDSYVTAEATESLAKRLGPRTEVWTVPRAKHNRPRLVAGQEYRQRILDHINQTLVLTEEDFRQHVA